MTLPAFDDVVEEVIELIVMMLSKSALLDEYLMQERKVRR